MNRKTILVIVVLIALIAFGFWVKRFWDIDTCLDKGGRWDYERGECVPYAKAIERDRCLNDGKQWDYEKGMYK